MVIIIRPELTLMRNVLEDTVSLKNGTRNSPARVLLRDVLEMHMLMRFTTFKL